MNHLTPSFSGFFSNRFFILTCLVIAGCSVVDEGADGEFALSAEDPELGKSLFEPASELDGKSDRPNGKEGLPISVDQGDSAVWEIFNQWEDTMTPRAKKAGIAWGEDSGLNWDEKYALWIGSMEKIEAHSYGETFTLTTPFGKSLPAPSIECAETSLFLRATFASWYNLPFFVEARDAKGKRLFLGHFGFLTSTGARYTNAPSFRTRYQDYSDQVGTPEWPQDKKLRGRRLGGSQDDDQPFLFEGAHAGAYFDEIFLNKRVGHFMVFLLSYFGSINLADSSNTFNIIPDGIREGDTLLHRWQRRGIGHTMVVKRVSQPLAGFFEVELISGSMPRRQPKWESPSSSKYNLTVQKGGGLEESGDEVPYARLGGGIKRWRIAKISSGRWTNSVPTTDRELYVSSNNFQAIGARVERFEELLVELTPELKREAILERVIAAREHLRRYPSSCAARIRREEAFTELYELEEKEFGSVILDVDQTYRKYEDYVLAPLSYDESKTCCWNSTDEAMYEIIMSFAQLELETQGENACVAPTVFKAYEGDYQIWADHAKELGREGEWVSWSEDETCDQRQQLNDVIDPEWSTSKYCDVSAVFMERVGE